MTDNRQRWREYLAAERRRRAGDQATQRHAAERFEAELDAMYERLIAATSGPPWSLSDASVAERLAVFGRWPPGVEVNPEQEASELERWFQEHGYSGVKLLHRG